MRLLPHLQSQPFDELYDLTDSLMSRRLVDHRLHLLLLKLMPTTTHRTCGCSSIVVLSWMLPFAGRICGFMRIVSKDSEALGGNEYHV